MVTAHEGKHKDLVKFIAGQTCLGTRQVQDLVRGYQLEQEITRISAFSEAERTQPSIFIACSGAPDPVALAKKAIEEGWTAEQTRQEAKRTRLTRIPIRLKEILRTQLASCPSWEPGWLPRIEVPSFINCLKGTFHLFPPHGLMYTYPSR